MSDVITFAAELKKQFPQKLPPVNLWNPPLSGDIDIRIAMDGKWFHEGVEIRRDTLVKLFSSILKKEEDEYYLVTPVEKWKIQVDCAPFVIVSCELMKNGGADKVRSNYKTGELSPVLCLTTNSDDKVFVDSEHPIWVEKVEGVKEELFPFVIVRDNLKGLINRNVYYQLVDIALDNQLEEEGSQEEIFIVSGLERFSLSPRTCDSKP
ncbi:MAG: DUF1285 domain-containing protein [Cellvibrionaceae bacterium]